MYYFIRMARSPSVISFSKGDYEPKYDTYGILINEDYKTFTDMELYISAFYPVLF